MRGNTPTHVVLTYSDRALNTRVARFRLLVWLLHLCKATHCFRVQRNCCLPDEACLNQCRGFFNSLPCVCACVCILSYGLVKVRTSVFKNRAMSGQWRMGRLRLPLQRSSRYHQLCLPSMNELLACAKHSPNPFLSRLCLVHTALCIVCLVSLPLYLRRDAQTMGTPEDTKSTEVFSKMLSLPESSSPITWTASAARELNFPA